MRAGSRGVGYGDSHIIPPIPPVAANRIDKRGHPTSARALLWRTRPTTFLSAIRLRIGVAYFTLWLVGFTAVLAFSTIGLWIVTAWGVRNQRRDTEILQRAYIAVEPAGLTAHRDREDRIHPSVLFRNVGNLPARQVRWRSNNSGTRDSETGEFANFGNGKGFPIDHLGEEDGAIVLPPGTVSLQRISTVFTKDLSNSFFVWGIVTYDDGFGNERFTRFCHVYSTKNIIGRMGVTLGPDAARLYEQGNDAN